MESMQASRTAGYRVHALRARVRELEDAAGAASGREAEVLRVKAAQARGTLIREMLAGRR